jgi:hypothetical protein
MNSSGAQQDSVARVLSTSHPRFRSGDDVRPGTSTVVTGFQRRETDSAFCGGWDYCGVIGSRFSD